MLAVVCNFGHGQNWATKNLCPFNSLLLSGIFRCLVSCAFCAQDDASFGVVKDHWTNEKAMPSCEVDSKNHRRDFILLQSS